MHKYTLAAFAATIIASPAAAQSRPATPPAPAPAPAPAAPAQTGYGAWFGSVPDMEGSFGGILLSGTSVGSPAEKAGLKTGDFLTAMAGKPVEDLAAMAAVLRHHKAGDTIDVVFVRNRVEQKTRVVLGVRPGG
jgi:S1-C subfamily serine protease